ncbi:hypothetical protein SKAU_G00213210 [Synaphobranchus kaupii]|uniref:Uncharacterized protein n=1 Tax=Synaphobranchus kaupii TaxID=118154 RepID=A0A9Q1F960_SYNKA|nr:hypothetical protein SKAU_G00213210 [Synaphobranchus kaupii]
MKGMKRRDASPKDSGKKVLIGSGCLREKGLLADLADPEFRVPLGSVPGAGAEQTIATADAVVTPHERLT